MGLELVLIKERGIMSDTPNKNQNNNNPPNNKNGGNKKFRNNKKKYSQNKNRRPKSLTPSRILQKYDNLMEQYLVARRKFFETQAKTNLKQKEKIIKSYQTSLKNLRTFEIGLEDWQKDVLKEKINAFPLDRQYTSEHNIEPIGDEVSFVGEFDDPHLLPTQKAEDWASDTDESSGSIEDYYSYKGISPKTS